MTRRFYFESEGLHGGDRVEISGPLGHRIARVLRLGPGDEITLFDGRGTDAVARIDDATPKLVAASIVSQRPSPSEPRTRVTLYQSITKGDRFEWLLEKGTEIGVTRFVPLLSARSVVKPEAGGNRSERWRRIVIEAAEQSGRGAVPAIDEPCPFTDALSDAAGVLLVPYEAAGEHAPDIATALRREVDALFALAEVSLFIGPEGGFEEEEVARAGDAGATIVTMGQRVLRSETAGLVAATLILHAAGELG